MKTKADDSFVVLRRKRAVAPNRSRWLANNPSAVTRTATTKLSAVDRENGWCLQKSAILGCWVAVFFGLWVAKMRVWVRVVGCVLCFARGGCCLFCVGVVAFSGGNSLFFWN